MFQVINLYSKVAMFARRLGVGYWLGAAVLCFGNVAPAHALDLKVGVYDNPPKIFFSNAGEAQGIFIDLLKHIAQAEGWTLAFERCDWEACLSMLEQGSIDLMPDVARTPERETRFDFHQQTALSSWSQLYRRPESKIDSVLDLKDQRIAVLASGIQRDALESMLGGFDFQFKLISTSSVAEAFSAVQQGRADVAAASYHYGDYQASKYGLVPTSIVFQPTRLYFAATRGRQAKTLEVIDGRLTQWKQSPYSPYYATLKSWGVSEQSSTIPTWWIQLAVSLLATALALAGIALWLRWRVKLTMAAMRAKTQELEAILRAVPDLLFMIDEQGTYIQVYANESELLVASKARLIGKKVAEVMPPDASQQVMKAVTEALRLGQSHGEQLELQLQDGAHWFELSTARMLPLPGRQPAVIMLSRDITQRVKDNAEIQRLADFDQLTGLPNRSLLHRLYEKVSSRAADLHHGLALVFLDIDHFKNINDSLGHQVGDQLLKEVSRRIQNTLRDSDIACRIGGDEFIVLLNHADVDAAIHVTQRLQHVLHFSFDLGPYQSGITASMGVAMFPEDGQDLDTLLRNADTAMYQAKSDGRNAARFFTSAMQARSERLLELSSALDLALDNDEIFVQYQPIIDLESGQINGAEALVRWKQPRLGMVSPAEFIPVAESSGQIEAIGGWVLEQACAQAVTWEFARRGWIMSVNVSFIQFAKSDFVTAVQTVLVQTGLAGNCLELELTESVAMGDIGKAKDTVRLLRELGVRIAVDDFGTGYSSMAYLRRLEFNKLKIDQSFVRNIGQDTADESIISATIMLAHSLGMKTQAEGVETKAQQDFLKREGCDFQQGWLFSKAVSPEEWMQWLH